MRVEESNLAVGGAARNAGGAYGLGRPHLADLVAAEDDLPLHRVIIPFQVVGDGVRVGGGVAARLENESCATLIIHGRG